MAYLKKSTERSTIKTRKKSIKRRTEIGRSTVPRSLNSSSASKNLFSKLQGIKRITHLLAKRVAGEGLRRSTRQPGRASLKSQPSEMQQTSPLEERRAEPLLVRSQGCRLPLFHRAARVLRQSTRADLRARPNSLFSLNVRTSMRRPDEIGARPLAVNRAL